MEKDIKIWFHLGSSSAIREFSVHKLSLPFLIPLVFTAFIGISYVIYDYYSLKRTYLNNTFFNKTISKQKSEIQNQRTQIQNFASEIEGLKKHLERLFKFEERIRLIAGIKEANSSNELIGIGGIAEDSLDLEIPLKEKHNNLMRQMHQQINETQFTFEKKSLDFQSLIRALEEERNILASTPSIRPIEGGWITSKFGYRNSPFTGKREFHSGLDIANKKGTKVIATADGKISYAGAKIHIGNVVIIDHGNGKMTKYGHLKKILVQPHQKIKRGAVIALLGNTGKSTGPHLHYEVRVNGIAVDPLKHILN